MIETFVGFDSAWTDSSKAPGAITAITLKDRKPVEFHRPRLASFAEALAFIQLARQQDGVTVVAIDQPTIVRNNIGMRPVERVSASLISWVGGGVQPANRSKAGMFCEKSPIWQFLAALNAADDPETARDATTGLHLIEVFPALALLSWDETLCARLAAPRYNPGRRKTFKLEDFTRVARIAEREFTALDLREPAAVCDEAAVMASPAKPDQDKLDALLCLLVALQWRLHDRSRCLMLGSLAEGYMITPIAESARRRLLQRATELGVPAR